jgi:hypothetical protein
VAADAVYDAIKTFLSTSGNVTSLANADTGDVPPMRFENTDFTKPLDDDGEPLEFIDIALTGVLYGQQSIGESSQANNCWDETGSLWLTVFVPKNSGGSRARQLTKLLADLFRGKHDLCSGNLEFLDAFIGLGAPAKEEGNWYELPCVIDWRRVEA